MMSQ